MTNEKTIDHRLEKLPTKVSLPFRRLLSSGQMSDETLSVILDAGELAGERLRLLGFAIGYLHLRSQGVPVHDVVRMAKSLGKPINLEWGAKRWKQEHDRLSRAVALVRLAGENTAYDVSGFAEHLPEGFSGYLIRSSRRLGMEGLRQRHCVASYHSRLVAGSCAIAAVFVGGRRWTVQLSKTGREEPPLKIVQIKSRFNEPPTVEVQKAIYGQLGISSDPEPQRTTRGREQDRHLAALRRILPLLRESGIERIAVDFDGGGDDGSITSVTCSPDGTEVALAGEVVVPSTKNLFDEGQWVRRTEETRKTLKEAIEELTYDYLEETGVDWCNDEGGFGELLIDTVRGSVHLDIEGRFTETVNQFSRENDILTGYEIG